MKITTKQLRQLIKEEVGKLSENYLTHGTDGPITRFVLIMRACEEAAKGKIDPEQVANDLYEALIEYGYLTSDHDDIYPTGS